MKDSDAINKIVNLLMSHLERGNCEWSCSIASTLLKRASIKHSVFIGTLEPESGRIVMPHYWIELDDDTVIDTEIDYWIGTEGMSGVVTYLELMAIKVNYCNKEITSLDEIEVEDIEMFLSLPFGGLERYLEVGGFCERI